MNVSLGNSNGAWRVLVTRDEAADGPLSRALARRGFVPVLCPVTTEQAPENLEELTGAAARLDSYDWVICSSTRAVHALSRRRAASWPRGLRSAAVGAQTAAALEAMGADPRPVTAAAVGAAPLWQALETMEAWPGRRVLALTVAGGRRELIDGLLSAGARVDEVVAYRMVSQALPAIARIFASSHADAVVFASPSAVEILNQAVGLKALRQLKAAVAIGATTGAQLREHGLDPVVPEKAGFDHVVETLAEMRAGFIGKDR